MPGSLSTCMCLRRWKNTAFRDREKLNFLHHCFHRASIPHNKPNSKSSVLSTSISTDYCNKWTFQSGLYMARWGIARVLWAGGSHEAKSITTTRVHHYLHHFPTLRRSSLPPHGSTTTFIVSLHCVGVHSSWRSRWPKRLIKHRSAYWMADTAMPPSSLLN